MNFPDRCGHGHSNGAEPKIVTGWVRKSSADQSRATGSRLGGFAVGGHHGECSVVEFSKIACLLWLSKPCFNHCNRYKPTWL